MNWRRTILVVAVLGLGLLLFGCGASRVYTVQRGDTLQAIAQTNNTTPTALVQLNKDRYPSLVTNPSRLSPGWELELPAQADASTEVEALLMRIARTANPPTGPAPAAPAAPNDKIASAVDNIVFGINQVRAEHGLPALTVDRTLTAIAQTRSDDMITRGYFSHTDPNTGKVLFQGLIEKHNYAYLFAGENIAEIRNEGSFIPPSFTVYNRYSAQDLADQFVTGWVNSPDHFENIVNPHFRRTGVAIAASSDGTRVVATQVFSD